MKSIQKKTSRLVAALVAATLSIGLAGCSSSTNSTDSSAKAKNSTSLISATDRVSVHDPSVIQDEKTGEYYVFGSHLAWAKSKDGAHWKTFTNNLTSDYETIFKDIWKTWPQQDSNPDVKGNMWAPDVIYNKALQKYCMYMSLNGAEYKSVIVMLTADSLDGDWTYVGPVVYSGFHNDTVKDTDVPQVLGNDADLTRYQSTTDTEINAIDPTVKYDTDGSLYMSFGSWFGGIWMLKLDAATGLRDYSAKYPTTPDVADAYYGTKLAGGHGNSGEGSYLLNTNGYWYLFLSYGNLQANGGYQIRMYRSQNIAGPYTDENGNTAISTSAEANNWEGENGIRLLSSYKWSGGPESIEVAQGHNSALVDKSGKTLMVYHTRFHDQGETHQIRVRELMPTADGWLVAAPYEYTGTTANTKGYETSSYSGDYELITHNPLTYFKGIKVNRKSNKFRGVNEPQKITLKKDGTVSGAVSGKWEADKGKNTMTITLDGQKYTGDFAQIPNEATGKKVMTFSALGKNICIWGSQQ